MNPVRKLVALSVAVLALVAVTVFAMPRAQVASAQDEMIQCDLTLITLLYVSEHVYGHFPMTDVSNIDKGQYAPLFDAMMEAMMEMTPTEEAMMEMTPTEEAMIEMTPTEEAMMDGTMLAHGDIPGEPQVCTDLRHELDVWFLEHFMHEMEMGM
ncbi:MAG: hypothetical protein SGJ24_18020 [Chloroflexota bacterium]|nr:hypothetical protein [Chloroflexota bacterium]